MKRSPFALRGAQDGVALVLVLWIIVLLSLIAAGHSRNAHTATRLSSHQVEAAQVRALARSGVFLAILDLASSGSPYVLPADGIERPLDILGESVRITIRPADGLVDLNAAGPQLLEALVATTSADRETRGALVAAIMDWRDPDDLERLGGAEADAYADAAPGYTIRNGAFVAVEDLRYVAGMTDGYYEHIAPLVTVYSGHSGIDMRHAPPALVAALSGDDAVQGPRFRTVDAAPVASTNPTAARAGIFHVRAEAGTVNDAGTVAIAEAVVKSMPGTNKPYAILAWREPMRAAADGSR